MLPQPAQRPQATELGALSFKIVGSGKSSGAAVGSRPLQIQEKEDAHCPKSAERRPSVGAAIGSWPEIEPVSEFKEPFRMLDQSQTELSKGSTFFMAWRLGGALNTE